MKTIRNEAERNDLIERILKLSGKESALWGKMNINQMVSHLVQAGEMPFGHDLQNRSNFMSRNVVKPLVLYVLSIPKSVKTSPDLNQQENGRKPLEFAEDKKSVINLLEKLGTVPNDFQCQEHPMFGKMNAKEWATMAHKHLDHHLKQFGV